MNTTGVICLVVGILVLLALVQDIAITKVEGKNHEDVIQQRSTMYIVCFCIGCLAAGTFIIIGAKIFLNS